MNESLGEAEYGFLHFGMKNEYFDGPYTRFLALLLLAQGRRNNISLLFTQLISLFFRLVVDAQFSLCCCAPSPPSPADSNEHPVVQSHTRAWTCRMAGCQGTLSRSKILLGGSEDSDGSESRSWQSP